MVKLIILRLDFDSVLIVVVFTFVKKGTGGSQAFMRGVVNGWVTSIYQPDG